MRLQNGETVLRNVLPTDIADYERWFQTETEWMDWDAPWEEWEEGEAEKFIKGIAARIDKTPDIFYRFEIATAAGEHIGWVNSYNMDEDKLAVGINIVSPNVRGKGHGERALAAFMAYLFEKTKKERLYTQTWSGNTRMVKLAEKLGFSVCDCKKSCRQVRGELYDGLTFCVTQEVFARG
jgi:Acetyltransferases, including N-acetylases of ribosomal proteins